jgi:hypothetical protein
MMQAIAHFDIVEHPLQRFIQVFIIIRVGGHIAE